MPKKCQTEYSCQQCDFFTSKESNFKNHLLTRKHKILQNTTKKSEKMPIFFCDCGKAYKHHSSLWNHKKQCQIINNKKYELSINAESYTKEHPKIGLKKHKGLNYLLLHIDYNNFSDRPIIYIFFINARENEFFIRQFSFIRKNI